MEREREFAEQLIEFVYKSPSRYHVVKNLEEALANRDFKNLDLFSKWILEKGKSYYVKVDDTMMVAFKVGRGDLSNDGFRVVASHTDSPEIVLKPNPEIVSEGYLKLNCEVYGGPILNTWMDRPLGIAGRVTIKSKDLFKPEVRLVDFEKPMLTIPNLAIHINRSVNEGIKLSPQKDMIPVLQMVEDDFEKDGYLIKLIAEKLDVGESEIVDFELNLYDSERGTLLGAQDEFISCGKLDNLAMVHSSLEGIMDSDLSDATSVFVAFDHEEIGSTTRQGAGSPVLQNILERVAIATCQTREGYLRALENSFMLSCDMVHALHPNKLEKQEITNKVLINSGPATKTSSRRTYTTDGKSYSVYKGICDKAGVKLQRFLNHSDERGGSTIGPISSTQLPVQSADVGNPMLGMHSIRELAGVSDHHHIYRTFMEFYRL